MRVALQLDLRVLHVMFLHVGSRQVGLAREVRSCIGQSPGSIHVYNRGFGQNNDIAMSPMRDGSAGNEWSYRSVMFEDYLLSGVPRELFRPLGDLNGLSEGRGEGCDIVASSSSDKIT